MKNKLIVMYAEDRSNPKNIWSGTSYQLREALKYYFDVVFIDSNDNKAINLLKILAKRIEKKSVSYILKPLYEILHKKTINKKLRGLENIPVLEISENVETKNEFYLYRDMAYACYPYVLNKFENDGNNYGKGMLRHVSKDALERRIQNELKLSNKAECSFFMGQWTVDILDNKYPNLKEKFTAVGGGLNNEFQCTVSSIEKKRIIFVGIDYLRKGGDLLIDAFKILKEKYDKDAELTIVGPDVKKQENGVAFAGKLNKNELSKEFSDSTVFCMPSRFEAYGLVFLEAQCYGLPIVAYDDYEMHYFVNDGVNGYLINKYDAEELAKALHKALNNKEMINRVRNNAIVFRQQHTWDAVAKKIADVINERSYNVK